MDREHDNIVNCTTPNFTSFITSYWCIVLKGFDHLLLMIGLSIVLPVTTHIPGFQVNYFIKVSNIFYGPIVLHLLLDSFLYNMTSQRHMEWIRPFLTIIFSWWHFVLHCT